MDGWTSDRYIDPAPRIYYAGRVNNLHSLLSIASGKDSDIVKTNIFEQDPNTGNSGVAISSVEVTRKAYRCQKCFLTLSVIS